MIWILISIQNSFRNKGMMGMINFVDRTRLMIVLKSRPDDETAAVFEFTIQRKVGRWTDGGWFLMHLLTSYPTAPVI